ncbi:MAG TPA: PEP-CTERM sorting domain-containing protein [Candidatus Limnocylindrales bacterium]|nr:PEP-CTERM sorting domain-containing protein [Candidatus Limnocylindrales bacterium]
MKTHGKTRLVSYSVAALSLFIRATSIKGRCIKGQIPIRNNGAIAVLLGLVLGTAWLASAQFDPSAQFSPTANPNGVWTYGYESVPIGSPFNLLTLPIPLPSVPGPVVDSWQSPAFGAVGVFHNGTAAAQSLTVGPETSLFNSGMLAMHAGPNDEYGMVQFSAPANGIYTIQGTFEGIDTGGTASTVYLLHNNVVVASGSVLGFGPGSDVPLASGPFLLNFGDTLAYAVGGGPFNSMTALINAQVAAVGVPEPSLYALLGLALVPLAARGGFARKRKAAIA